jgi:cell growth-regulating nucleolar protein
MVVFTCNHCGESLQKPRVEKHYNMQCRRSKSLTCVDCFKDFKDEEYVVHTKCITEEERYSAKGSIPGGIVKKGDVKQESWIDMIKSIVQNELNLKPSLKNLMNTISTYSNVPRKKAKFINFLQNSLGGRANFNDIEAAWSLIEKYKNEQSKDNSNASNKQQESTVKENETKHKSTDNGEDAPVKKKKKLEQVDDQKVDVEMSENGLQPKNDDKEKPKKKKKESKKQELDEGINIETKENGLQNEIQPKNDKEKQKKKKKESKKQELEEGINIESKENVLQNEIQPKNDEEKPKKKKKQSKKQACDEVIKLINIERETMDLKKEAQNQQNDVETKEKKSQYQTNGDEGSYKKKLDKVNVELEDTERQNSSSFNFKDAILKILNSKGSMSCKKLQKKVLSAYLMETGNAEYSEKTVKKYNKKLKKIGNVSVNDDVVSLLENVE